MLITFVALFAVLAAGVSLLPQPSTQAATPGPGAGPTVPREEVLVVRLYFKDMVERDRLASEWSPEEVDTLGGYLTILTDRAGLTRMQNQGLRAEIDQEMTRQINNPNLFGENSPDTFYGGYRTVEEMQALLNQYATTYPGLAEVVDYGDSWCKQQAGGCTITNPSLSWNGYDLLALHITNRSIPGLNRSTGTKPGFTRGRSARRRSPSGISSGCWMATPTTRTPTGWWTIRTSG